MAHGAIIGYGLHEQVLHGQLQPDRKWTHRVSYALADLGGIDKLQAAVGGSMTPALMARAAEVFDMPAHTDDVLMVLHHGGLPAPAAPPPPAPAKKAACGTGEESAGGREAVAVSRPGARPERPGRRLGRWYAEAGTAILGAPPSGGRSPRALIRP